MSTHVRLMAVGVFVAAATVLVSAHAITGPSSSSSPYVRRAEPGVVSAAILTVGDAIDGYRLVGIPDGLGAFDNLDGTFTLLVNHEIPAAQGVPRAEAACQAKLAEIHLHFHDLRHEAGSRKLEAGWPPHAVSMWLGHSKTDTTSVYLNADNKLLHELNDRGKLM